MDNEETDSTSGEDMKTLPLAHKSRNIMQSSDSVPTITTPVNFHHITPIDISVSPIDISAPPIDISVPPTDISGPPINISGPPIDISVPPIYYPTYIPTYYPTYIPTYYPTGTSSYPWSMVNWNVAYYYTNLIGEGDGLGNSLYILSNGTSLIVYYSRALSTPKIVNYFTTIQNESTILYYPLVITPGPSGTWLVTFLAVTQTEQFIITYFTNDGAMSQTWDEERYIVTPSSYFSGLSIATNQQGTWVMCIYVSLTNGTQYVDCSQTTSTPPVFKGFLTLNSTSTKINYSFMWWQMGSQYYSRYERNFLSWGNGVFLLVIGNGKNLLYSVSHDDGITWSIPNSLLLESEFQYTLASYLEYNNQGVFNAGYLSTNDGYSVSLLYSTLINECVTNTHACDTNSTVCSGGGQPDTTYVCNCLPNYSPSTNAYTCIDNSDTCALYGSICQQLCISVTLTNTTGVLVPKVVCGCFSGFTLISGSCIATTPWRVEPSPFGPDIPSPSMGIFVDSGLLYIHGLSNFKADNTYALTRYILSRNRWTQRPLSLDATSKFTIKNNVCMMGNGVDLWMIGGANSLTRTLEIWKYDIVIEDFILLSLEGFVTTVPLESPSCALVNSSTLLIYGGFTLDSSGDILVNNTMYEVAFNSSYMVTGVQLYSPSMKRSSSFWPPPLYGSLFSQLTSTENADITMMMLIGGSLSAGANGYLTPDSASGFMFQYLGQGSWSAITIDNSLSSGYLPKNGRSYHTAPIGGTIFIMDLSTTPYAISRLIQLHNQDSIDWYWTPWFVNTSSYSFTNLLPKFIFSATTTPSTPIVGMLARDTTSSGIKIYTFSSAFLQPPALCSNPRICVNPARCILSDQFFSDATGFTCYCPSSYTLSNDQRSCHNNSSNTNLFIGVGVGIAIFVIILIIVFVVLYTRLSRVDVSLFPEDIRWSFDLYYSNSRSWTKKGEGSTVYYSYDLKPGSDKYQKVIRTFNEKLGAFTSEGQILVSSIQAIFNPTLINNFLQYQRLRNSRFASDPSIFLNTNWKTPKEDPKGRRSFVYKNYQTFVAQFPWNDISTVETTAMAIIPVLHGTSLSIAEKVSEKGFVAISALDAGYYGKGIYFTTRALYAVPYFVTKPDPALVITYVMPGNPYPVIEGHTGKKNLLGKGLVGSAIAHYVLTRRDGLIAGEDEKYIYDELVVSQESALLPAFIIQVDKSNLPSLIKTFQRELPEEESFGESEINNSDQEAKNKQKDDRGKDLATSKQYIID